MHMYIFLNKLSEKLWDTKVKTVQIYHIIYPTKYL